ncbi:MAG: (deoxy)nucleoside triphosphate pyrophosphohydrolase [Hyphomonadaceae bacterium]|nr:(deoxy)nucleoside triphosphate pyrophosphohydrolase [Hyphomonadaceae bacterium]MBX3510623.1 (deoxy)nucleoside triphosphate pyrophosphohydrolase [Hyphomonadaceae bacterium]
MQTRDNTGPGRRLLLVAAAALIDAQGRVLITQRPAHKQMGGLWEFPGGKVELGEAPEQALARELKEELDLTVEADALDPFAFASHAYPDFHLLMPLYIATRWKGEPKLDPNSAQAMAWAAPPALRDYAMPPADIVLVERLIERSAA